MTDPSERPPVDRQAPGAGRVPIHEIDPGADAVRIADREPPLPEGFEERPLPAAPAA